MKIAPVSFASVRNINHKKQQINKNTQKRNSNAQSQYNTVKTVGKEVLAMLLISATCCSCASTSTVEPTIADIQSLPTYGYIEKEIFDINYNELTKNLSDKKRNQLEDRVDSLEKKLEDQKAVAQAYCDNEFVRFIIDIKPDENGEYPEMCVGETINVEDFKVLFDIEDGAIRAHNDLNVGWISHDMGDGSTASYKDYSVHNFKNGDVVKIPIKAILTDEINLDGYQN